MDQSWSVKVKAEKRQKLLYSEKEDDGEKTEKEIQETEVQQQGRIYEPIGIIYFLHEFIFI